MDNQIVKLTSRDEIDHSLEVNLYVMQQMSDKERIDFEAKLVNDRKLQQALTEELNLRNLICGDTSEQEISDYAFNQFSASLNNGSKNISKKIVAGIAASFLLVIFSITLSLEKERDYFETLFTLEDNLVDNSNENLYTVVFETNISLEQIKGLQKQYQFLSLFAQERENTFIIDFGKKPDPNVLQQLKGNAQIVFLEPAVSSSKAKE